MNHMKHQICSALFASNLLKSMSARLSDLKSELLRSAKWVNMIKTNADKHDLTFCCFYFESEFEEMAIGVLTLFDKSTDDIIDGVILLKSDCEKFVSLFMRSKFAHRHFIRFGK